MNQVPKVNWLTLGCIADSGEWRLWLGLQSSNPVLFPAMLIPSPPYKEIH